VGLGPLPPAQTQQEWGGLFPGTPHYLRLNTLTSSGWFPSATVSFTTIGCGAAFTTVGQTVPATTASQVTLTNVSVGFHPAEGYDRIVYEFTNGLPTTTVQYGGPAIGCGSGLPIAVQGVAYLKVRMTNTVAHNDMGQATIPASQIPGSGQAIVEARQTCDFEGIVEWTIGTDTTAPFRVFTLTTPPRIVIDVQR
jgi:hypothetical protein